MNLFGEPNGLHGTDIYCQLDVDTFRIVSGRLVFELVVVGESKDFGRLKYTLPIVLALFHVDVNLEHQFSFS